MRDQIGDLSPTLKRMVGGCSLPIALEAMGERWSFMILLAAFNGLCHFEEFQGRLGIARNILASRLAKLVEKEILTRSADHADRRRVHYRLTAKGKALLPTLIALRQWGEEWESGRRADPVLVDLRDGLPVETITVRAHDGRLLEIEELAWRDGANVLNPVGRRSSDLPAHGRLTDGGATRAPALHS